MQVFFLKKVNFLCTCSDTQKVLFVKTKAHDPYRQMHSESHTFSVSSIYNIILSIRIQLPPESAYRPHPCIPIKNFI